MSEQQTPDETASALKALIEDYWKQRAEISRLQADKARSDAMFARLIAFHAEEQIFVQMGPPTEDYPARVKEHTIQKMARKIAMEMIEAGCFTVIEVDEREEPRFGVLTTMRASVNVIKPGY
ncbi:MAG: hypothetical protein ACYSUC_12315 [Planctomycetota bacterium]|jgi:hypothetical protein